MDAQKHGGLFAIEERTVEDLLSNIDVSARTYVMAAAAPLEDAVKVLKGIGTDVLIGVDDAGNPVGTIIRAHRRY